MEPFLFFPQWFYCSLYRCVCMILGSFGKNNVVPDSPNHSNMAVVTPECSLSCKRYIKKYSNKTETNVKREINNAYESELRDMTTVISDINSSCSRYNKEYSSKTKTNFNNLKQEIIKNYSTLQTNFNKYSKNTRHLKTIHCWDLKRSKRGRKTRVTKVGKIFKRFLIKLTFVQNKSLMNIDNKNQIKDFDYFLSIRSSYILVKNAMTYWLDMLWYSLMSLGVCEVVLTIVLVCCIRKVHELKRQLDRQLSNGFLTLKPTNMATRQIHSNQKVNTLISLQWLWKHSHGLFHKI